MAFAASPSASTNCRSIQVSNEPRLALPQLSTGGGMAAGHPLRRWKRFLASFAAIDAAIEAAGPGISRDEFRRARCAVVERLCDASDSDDDEAAGELCRALDGVMAESLLTLRMVPVKPAALLASTELVAAVRALEKHESERVRSLARDVLRGWRASAEEDLVEARAAMDMLSKVGGGPDEEDEDTTPGAGEVRRRCHTEEPAKLPSQPSKKKPAGDFVTPAAVSTKTTSSTVIKKTLQVTAASAGGNHPPAKVTEPAARKKTAAGVVATTTRGVRVESTKVSEPPPRTTTSRVTGSSSGGERGIVSGLDGKIEASKRKLREGYQEEEDAKRQRKIQVIRAPEVVRQRERKRHPIMRERSRVRCASSVTVTRCFRAP